MHLLKLSMASHFICFLYLRDKLLVCDTIKFKCALLVCFEDAHSALNLINTVAFINLPKQVPTFRKHGNELH